MGRARFFRRYPDDLSRRRLYLIGLVLVPLVQLAPWLGSRATSLSCDAMNRERAMIIVGAVADYHQANGEYPADLTALVPDYLDALLAPSCFDADVSPYTQHEYELVTCRGGQVVSTVDAFSTDFIQRYDLATGQWSTVSFLDGVCSFLP